MQQEGFQLSYDLSQAANLLGDAAPCLLISQVDIWMQVADRLPFTPENLYIVQSLEVEFLDDFVKKHSANNAVVGLGGGRVADIAKYLHWKKEIILYQIPTFLAVDAFFTHEVEDIKMALDTLTEFVRRQKLPYTILHEENIPATLLEKTKKALTI